MRTDFLSLLPFLKALQRQMISVDDDDTDQPLDPQDQQNASAAAANSNGSPAGAQVIDAAPWINAPSRIPQAGPDVKPPNLRFNDPQQQRATLAGLMQGLGGQNMVSPASNSSQNAPTDAERALAIVNPQNMDVNSYVRNFLPESHDFRYTAAATSPDAPLVPLTEDANYSVSGRTVTAKRMHLYFHPTVAAALGRAIQEMNSKGVVPEITSAFRTPEDQGAMPGVTNNPVARISTHEAGMGVDFGGQGTKKFDAIIDAMKNQGFVYGGDFTGADPPHFDGRNLVSPGESVFGKALKPYVDAAQAHFQKHFRPWDGKP